jgi:splicing factor 3B subunit 3
VHVLKYKRAENSLVVFADDVATRHTTALTVLDHDTVAGADKFGNVFVVRVPKDVSDDADNPTGNRLLWDSSRLNGAPNKLQHVAQFYVGETVTSLQRAAMAGGQVRVKTCGSRGSGARDATLPSCGAAHPNGSSNFFVRLTQECILYSTIHGSVGALLPLSSKEDADLFTHLELFLRGEAGLSPVGREHVSFRSYFMPVKDVLDGDLCECYGSLPADRQRAIASDLDRSVQDVMKKLEDTRNKIL